VRTIGPHPLQHAAWRFLALLFLFRLLHGDRYRFRVGDQKDLGKGTAKTAEAMKRYDPGPTWKKVEADPQDSPPGK
jgi:hypothetical protein